MWTNQLTHKNIKFVMKMFLHFTFYVAICQNDQNSQINLLRFIEFFLLYFPFIAHCSALLSHKKILMLTPEQFPSFSLQNNKIIRSLKIRKSCTAFSFSKLSTWQTKWRQWCARKTSARSISLGFVPTRSPCSDQLMYLAAHPNMLTTRLWIFQMRNWSS